MDYGEDDECIEALFKIYKKEGNYKEALKFGSRLADLCWKQSYRWGDLSNIINTMFEEMLRANRKKDALRLLDSYGKYLDYYNPYNSRNLRNRIK